MNDALATKVQRRTVGVVVAWEAVENAWTDHRWRVTSVLDGAPDMPDWTCIDQVPGRRVYYAGAAELELYPRETDTLKHNLDGPSPAIYVFLRRSENPPGLSLLGVTACVGEAHAHADTGSDLVEPVSMPPDVAAWIADFVARHHVETQPFRRRREGVGEGGAPRTRRSDAS